MVAQVSDKTTFGLVPFVQFGVMSLEKPAVMRLWYHCWKSDPYGSRWMPLVTDLTGKTLKEAKSRMRKLGYFQFKSEVMISDEGKRYWQSFVVNLQGSETKHWNNNKTSETVTEYEKFLLSDYWQNVRFQILERDCHTCQKCGATQHLHVHHLTYANHGQEHLHLEDLITLCRNCHAQEHGICQ